MPTHAKLAMGVAILYTTHYITYLHAYACTHWPVYEMQRNEIINNNNSINLHVPLLVQKSYMPAT